MMQRCFVTSKANGEPIMITGKALTIIRKREMMTVAIKKTTATMMKAALV